jgi:hypothetical protein
MRLFGTLKVLVAVCALSGLAGVPAGCDDGDDDAAASDSDSDADSDADADTDADSDTGSGDECTPTATWGSGFEVGSPVANWALNGLFDQNGDGTVETDAVDFTLEDIYCAGFKSVVIAVSDADCGACPSWWQGLASGGLVDSLAAAHSTLLMFYSGGLGASSKTPQECYEYFSADYGFEPGFYVSGPPSQFDFPYFPFGAVIDLNTGVLLGKDIDDTNYLTLTDIVSLVQQADAE